MWNSAQKTNHVIDTIPLSPPSGAVAVSPPPGFLSCLLRFQREEEGAKSLLFYDFWIWSMSGLWSCIDIENFVRCLVTHWRESTATGFWAYSGLEKIWGLFWLRGRNLGGFGGIWLVMSNKGFSTSRFRIDPDEIRTKRTQELRRLKHVFPKFFLENASKTD